MYTLFLLYNTLNYNTCIKSEKLWFNFFGFNKKSFISDSLFLAVLDKKPIKMNFQTLVKFLLLCLLSSDYPE